MSKIVFRLGKGLYLFYHGYKPYSTLEDFQGDLNEMLYDLPWDSDTAPRQGSDMLKYKIIEMELPIFIDSVKEYIQSFYEIYSFLKYIHPNRLSHRNLTKDHYKKLWNLCRDNPEALFTIQTLLQKKKPRSSFTISLITQIITWLDEKESKYNSPLSRRQMERAMSYNSHDFHRCKSANGIPKFF